MSLGLMAALSASLGAAVAVLLARAGRQRLVGLLALLVLALAVGMILAGHFIGGYSGLGWVALATVFVLPCLGGLALGALAARLIRR